MSDIIKTYYIYQDNDNEEIKINQQNFYKQNDISPLILKIDGPSSEVEEINLQSYIFDKLDPTKRLSSSKEVTRGITESNEIKRRRESRELESAIRKDMVMTDLSQPPAELIAYINKTARDEVIAKAKAAAAKAAAAKAAASKDADAAAKAAASKDADAAAKAAAAKAAAAKAAASKDADAASKAASKKKKKTLSVLTYNVHNFYGNVDTKTEFVAKNQKFIQQMKLINEQNADIIALQEVSVSNEDIIIGSKKIVLKPLTTTAYKTWDNLKTALNKYHLYFKPYWGRKLLNIIGIKKELVEDIKDVEIVISSTSKLKFKIKDSNIKLTVVGIHLNVEKDKATSQLKTILENIEETETAIIMGDFNMTKATIDSEIFTRFATNPVDGQTGLKRSSVYGKKGPIDLILYNKSKITSTKAKKIRVDGDDKIQPSDHYPVFQQLEIRA